MYNSELKEKFIQEYTESVSKADSCKLTFNAVEPYEVAWGADICTKTKEDLQDIVDEIIGLRASKNSSRLVILRTYVKWCIKNNVRGACDGMLQVDTSGISKMRCRTVANPLHLQNYLNTIFNPESFDDMDNIYRCYCWMAYGGVPEKDTINIKSTDIDFENMVISYNKSEFPIYKEAIPAFKKCVNLVEFVSKNRNYKNSFCYKRVSGDLLLRGTRGLSSIKTLRIELSSRSADAVNNNITNIVLSYKRIELSGLFYRLYERECASIPPNFLAVAAGFMERKTYNTSQNLLEIKMKRLAKQYKDDYERWKLAFSTK